MRKNSRLLAILLIGIATLYTLQRRADAAGTNLALSGTGYRWNGLTSLTSNSNRNAAAGINDNNLTTDVILTGNTNTDDPVGTYEAAGVIWSTAQTITSVNYINGSFDSNLNGVFTGNFGLQFTTDGTTWTNSGWSFTPAYAYDSASAAKITYVFTGSATSVLGVRGVGQVHATANSTSWHANTYEVQAFGGASAPTNTPTNTSIPTNTSTTAPTNTLIPTTGGSDGTPYGGTAAVIPGRVEAENYNVGGEGIAYHDTTAGNAGGVYRTDDVDIQACTDTGCGYNIGWVIAGEWTKYTVNVTTSGTYDITFRVASTKTTGMIHLEVDGTDVTGSLAVPNTGAWQTYTDLVKSGVSLSAGQHVLRLVSDVAGENYNYIDFALSGGATNTPVNTSTSAPTNTATATLTGSAPPPTNTSTSVPTSTNTPTFVPPTFTSTSTPTQGSGGPTATIPADTANTFVRINQVGYISGDAKIAILQASGTVTGTYKVVSTTSNTVLFTGNIPSTSLGSWSTTFPDNYKLDFSSVTTPGTYYIQVTGSRNAHSYKFKIDSGANVYTPLISNGLFFYEAQRDGPNTLPVISRGPSHLTDETASIYANPTYDSNDNLTSSMTKIGGPIDVSGGWFDAGDLIKFTYTASYTDAMLLFAVRDHSSTLGTGGSVNLQGEAQFGADWLQKMWDGNTKTLYYQVGIGNGNASGTILGDHDPWRLPETDDKLNITSTQTSNAEYYVKYRPVFRANTPGGTISPNMAGRVAADFALCYQVFRVSDPTYANKCLVSAEQVYALANTSNPGSTMLTTAPHDYYPGDEVWHSDMAWGAVELYNALHQGAGSLPSGLTQTDPNFYLTQGATWAKDSQSDTQDSLNLYHVDGIAYYELYKAIGQAGGSYAITQSALLAAIKAHVTGAISGVGADPFGQGYTANDIVPHALGEAVEANFYDKLSGTQTYRAYEMSKLDWVLGNNAWGSSYIVGDGTIFPFCMQHQSANLVGSLNGTLPLVLGATTDGPNASSTFSGLTTPSGARNCPADGVDHFSAFNANGLKYIDNVSSWPSSEPADDYTVIGVVAFAQQLP